MRAFFGDIFGINSCCPKYIILTCSGKGPPIMNKFKWIVIFTAIACLLASTGVNAENARGPDQAKINQPVPKTIKNMIFITVEGLSDEMIQSAYTPNINGLAASGVRTTAVGVLPANHEVLLASLLSGADPSVHRFTQPGQQMKIKLLPDIICSYGRSCVFISNIGTIPEGLFRQGGVRTYEVRSAKNEALISKAIDIFNQNQPFFLGVRLSGIEDKLLGSNNKAKVVEAVNDLDEQIGRLLTTLSAYGVFDESLIVLTGNNSGSELMVPVIMAGPGLKSAANLPPVKIIDIAPTAALLAGLQIAPESNGMVLWNALRSGTGFLEQNLLLKRIKDLSEEDARLITSIYSLGEEKRLMKVEKENVAREKAQIKKTVEGKEGQIRILKWEIKFLRLIEVVTIIAMGVGYMVEYFYLRKKFLMF